MPKEREKKEFDYFIITNSPGELSAWVYPVVCELRKQDPDSRINVLLVPCFYATGREKQIAETFEAVDNVFTPQDFLRFSFGLKVGDFKPYKNGAVISLGGDPWHAVLISKKLKYPAFLYTMKKADTGKCFKHIFSIHEKLRQRFLSLGIKPENISVVGDLMRDGVKPVLTPEETRKKLNISDDKKIVTFFPGSRLPHVEESLPVFMKTCEEIKEKIPNTEFVICLSPFVNFDDVNKFIKQRNKYIIDGTWGTLKNGEIITAGNTKIKLSREYRYDIVKISDLVITIPGTNTAEIASLGKPMIVAFTWNAKIPSGGIGFLLNLIPATGFLKKSIMMLLHGKVKFKGLPNALAEKELTPELMVDKGSYQLSSLAIELLNDPERCKKISEDLLGIMGGGGAGVKIASKIIEIAQKGISE